jgi:putative redox protein
LDAVYDHRKNNKEQVYMATSKVKYSGSLRTECVHLNSGSVIHTDAPLDNNGKGEKFSPTDLLATAYASCMLTIIGIHCQDNDIHFAHGEADVTKVMASGPRRIVELHIEMDLRGNGWDEQTAERIIRVAEACPVAKSVHPDIKIEIKYHV